MKNVVSLSVHKNSSEQKSRKFNRQVTVNINNKLHLVSFCDKL